MNLCVESVCTHVWRMCLHAYVEYLCVHACVVCERECVCATDRQLLSVQNHHLHKTMISSE